jgi:heptaprenyl diphosphate synthase
MISRIGAACDIPALDEFVARVAARVRLEISRAAAAQPAASLAEAGGKYLRTRLLWLSAAAVAPRAVVSGSESILRVATAIELAHLGSLIHDDIVDGATTRRAIPCAHLRSGTEAAYRAGTTLLHLASFLVADFPIMYRTSLARAVLAMCRGQVRELMSLFQPCSRGERLAIVRDKTAALFEATASMGVTVVGGSVRQAKALRAFARALGVAYQIKDDLMDLVGDPIRLGRANGSDLWDGVVTLPVLMARERSRPVALMLQRIRAQRAAPDVARCIHLIRESGAIETATGQAHRWSAAASGALRSVPMDEGAQASLDALVQHLARVEHAARIVVDDTPARARIASQLQFRTPDAASERPQAFHSDRANHDGDSLILRRLALIEPTLAEMVVALMQTRTAPRQPIPSSRIGRGVMPLAIVAAMRATELARAVSSSSAFERSPTTCVAAADCLEAVAFTCLAESPSTLHACVEEMHLAGLRTNYGAPNVLAEPMCGAPSPP